MTRNRNTVGTDDTRGGALPYMAGKKAEPAGKTRGAAPEVKASALLGGSGSGGIASPLVETAYANRTFHSTVNITSTDGLFTLKIKPVKEIKFLDSNLRPVTIEFKSP